MSVNRKVTPSLLLRKKRRGEKITLLTAYDYPIARFINQAGVDIILVSDAVGTVGNGRPEAVSVSVDEMIYHTQAVRNGAGNSMVVTTLPFGSYESSKQAVETAVRLMKEGGADGVHLDIVLAQFQGLGLREHPYGAFGRRINRHLGKRSPRRQRTDIDDLPLLP